MPYCCCHIATSGALKASHQRNNVGISAISLSLVTLEKHRRASLLRPFFHSALPRPKTPQFLLLFLLPSSKELWSGSRRMLLLFSPRAFSSSHSSNLGGASSTFFSSSFFQGLSSMFCTLSSLPMLCPYFFLLHNGPTAWHPLLLSSRSVILLSMLRSSCSVSKKPHMCKCVCYYEGTRYQFNTLPAINTLRVSLHMEAILLLPFYCSQHQGTFQTRRSFKKNTRCTHYNKTGNQKARSVLIFHTHTHTSRLRPTHLVVFEVFVPKC